MKPLNNWKIKGYLIKGYLILAKLRTMRKVEETREAVRVEARSPSDADQVYQFWLSYADWYDAKVIRRERGYKRAFSWIRKKNKGPRKKWEKDSTSHGRQMELFI